MFVLWVPTLGIGYSCCVVDDKSECPSRRYDWFRGGALQPRALPPPDKQAGLFLVNALNSEVELI